MALAVRLALLAGILAKAESPFLKLHCAGGEYPHLGQLCCKVCPAGTHVGEHCITPHTLGHCIPCIEGETYTEYENGLDHCLFCDKCKPGYKMVRPCTANNNTKCQCPEGFYCPPGCEECIKCKKKCPKGQVEVQSCSPVTDMECKPGTTDSTLQPIIIVVLTICLIAIFVGFLVFFACKKENSPCKREKEKEAKVSLISGGIDILNTRLEAPATEGVVLNDEVHQNIERCNLVAGRTNEESTSGNAPSAPLQLLPEESAILRVQSNVPESKKPVVKVIHSSSKELAVAYFKIKDMVHPNDWNNLMRKSGLSDNDIYKIKHDNPYHLDEACHQMLKTLQDQFGIADALSKLLDGLWDLKLMNIYQNVTNELKSLNLIILETKD